MNSIAALVEAAIARFPEIAYQTVFGLNVVLQILARVWFALPRYNFNFAHARQG